MNDISRVALAFLGGVITLAIIAVVVSQRSDTPQVIAAGSSGLAGIIQTADLPVTG